MFVQNSNRSNTSTHFVSLQNNKHDNSMIPRYYDLSSQSSISPIQFGSSHNSILSSHLSTSLNSNITSYEQGVDHAIQSEKAYSNASQYSYQQLVDLAIQSEKAYSMASQNSNFSSYERLVDYAIQSEKAHDSLDSNSNVLNYQTHSMEATWQSQSFYVPSYQQVNHRTKDDELNVHSMIQDVVLQPQSSNVFNYQQANHRTKSELNAHSMIQDVVLQPQSSNVLNYQQDNYRTKSELHAHSMMQDDVVWQPQSFNVSNYEWQVDHNSNHLNLPLYKPNMLRYELSMGDRVKSEEAPGNSQNQEALWARQLNMTKSDQAHVPLEVWPSSNSTPYYYYQHQ